MRVFLRSRAGFDRPRLSSAECRRRYWFWPTRTRAEGASYCDRAAELSWSEMEAKDTARRQLLARARIYESRETYWEIPTSMSKQKPEITVAPRSDELQ